MPLIILQYLFYFTYFLNCFIASAFIVSFKVILSYTVLQLYFLSFTYISLFPSSVVPYYELLRIK